MRLPEYRVGIIRVLACLLLGSGVTPAASAAPLFDDHEVLDVHLGGPLSTVFSERDDANPGEHPFLLTIGTARIPVRIRSRGQSRLEVCRFPPLRLDFRPAAITGTLFEGQGKLKLVTHCRSDSERAENNVLEEYLAYRIFNELSEASYRVRLLRIRYEDANDELRYLDRPYYGFVIESDRELAERLGGEVVNRDSVSYAQLDNGQAGLFYVFQYLISNVDWSFVRATAARTCCHNVDLIDVDGALFTVPYDFDQSGLVNASYAAVPDQVRSRRVTQRVYRGYCRTPIEDVAAALETARNRKAEIMQLVKLSPVVGNARTENRTRYIGKFFELADKRDKLLRTFERACVGKR